MRSAVHLAFSTWTILPLPPADWQAGRKTVLEVFPLVGLPLALVMAAYIYLASVLSFNPLLFSGFAVAIPAVYTGGIHLDGFLDVADAVSSHAPREKKLEILKDPHIGAFSVIWMMIWAVTSLGLWSGLNLPSGAFAVCPVYIQSRLLTTVLAGTLPNARPGGMLADLKSGAGRFRPIHILLSLLIFALQICFLPLTGLIMLVFFTAAFFLFRHSIKRQFGGLTGDMLGCFIISLEWLGLSSALIGQSI